MTDATMTNDPPELDELLDVIRTAYQVLEEAQLAVGASLDDDSTIYHGALVKCRAVLDYGTGTD